MGRGAVPSHLQTPPSRASLEACCCDLSSGVTCVHGGVVVVFWANFLFYFIL